jgi:hypothetical protein
LRLKIPPDEKSFDQVAVGVLEPEARDHRTESVEHHVPRLPLGEQAEVVLGNHDLLVVDPGADENRRSGSAAATASWMLVKRALGQSALSLSTTRVGPAPCD